MVDSKLTKFTIVVTPKGAPAVRSEIPTFELRQINWNDAGYMTTYDATIRMPLSPDVELGYVKIMHRQLTQGEFSLDIGELKPLSSEFCALGQSFTFYEQLAGLSDELGEDFLRRIRDVVISPSRFRRFRDDEIFETSLARESRAIRALEDAPKLFAIKGARKTSKLPKLFHASIPLGPNHIDLQFNFRDISKAVSTRVTALVGDNGTGKSAILGALAESAIQLDDETPKRVGSIHLPRHRDSRVNFARVITISYGAFDEHSILRPRNLREPEGEPSGQRRYFYRGLRSWTPDGGAQLKSVDQIEDELWEAISSISDDGRRNAFRRSVALLRAATDFPLDVIDELFAPEPRRVSISHLSSGQKIVLNVLVSLIAYLEPGSLVLIDEPEVHLHPPLISALMRGIAACLEEFESIAIVATHSSVVIQELPARNVRIIRRIDDQTIIAAPTIETYGESLGVIDREVFGLSGIATDFSKVLRRLTRSSTLAAAERKLGIPLSTQAMAIWLQDREDIDA